MTLSEIRKTIRQNAAAIITAGIVFLLVTNYLAFIIPKNEAIIDDYNRTTLEEFNHQFNGTLKDYSNQVDLRVFKFSLLVEAYYQYDSENKERTKLEPEGRAEKQLMDSIIRMDENGFYGNIKEYVVIKSVTIDSIINHPGEIEIARRINFKFTPEAIEKFKIPNPDSELMKRLCSLRDNKLVRKSELTNRLSGAIEFKDWMIYTSDNAEFLNKNIDLQEFDSIAKSASKLGILTFSFSDKRFYKQSFSVEGTDFKVTLIGAVNQTTFKTKAKMVDVNVLTICILLVVLLFLAIPMVKPIISSAKEKLTQMDLLNTTTGIGVFTIVLASYIFTSYLSNCYQKNIRNELSDLHDKVNTSLMKELSIYDEGFALVQNQLNPGDNSFFHKDLNSIPKLTNAKLKKNLQNFFTFSKEGDIVKNISTERNYVLRKNFAERDYFKELNSSIYNSVLTAVYSKNDNKYKLVYIQKRSESAYSGYAFVPDLRDFPKTDGNTGYMLCSKSGRVIFHSDSTKRLNENIYSNTQRDQELSKLFHGLNDSCFEMNYNGDQCLFYAKKLALSNTPSPVYLLTYKNLNFSDNLKIYTLVNGFILSLGYVMCITFVVLLFSIVFNLGNIPVISRFHFYWFFPDNSREREYRFLRIVNFSFFSLFFILFVLGAKNVLYFAMLTGLNLAFFSFVLINQRTFLLFNGSPESRKKLYTLIGSILLFGYILPFVLNTMNFPGLGFSLSLFGHLLYLYFLKKDTKKNALPQDHPEKSTISKRNSFIGFFSSVMCYHYLLIPSIILLGLFNNEIRKVNDYEYSATKMNVAQSDLPQEKATYSDARLYNQANFVQAPSQKIIERINFDVYHNRPFDSGFKKFMFPFSNIRGTFIVFFLLISMMLMIKRLINYYSGRFFFFDLSEAYRLGYFETVNEFTNFRIILPPFNDEDLEALEKHERFAPDENKELKQQKWLKEIPGSIVSNEVKMDLIMMDNFKTYHSEYKQVWNSLTDDEKFAMHDFAIDHFVNYKSKGALISLMEKGYVIADPLTGRLRVMNYGFRNFVIHLIENSPEELVQVDEEKARGTFSKWKLPIIIVAVSALLLMMYLSKESFNQILFVGGSVLSAMGLIAKFVDTYKK